MLLTPPNTTSVWWFNHFLQAKPGSIVCRYMVYTLAIWTIISHIHVFFGGSLFQLIITAFTILCLYTILIVSIKFDLISFLSIRAIDKIWTNQSLPLYIPRLNPSASIESYFYIKLKWIIGLGGAILVAILFYISKSFLVYWWASVIYYSAAYLFVIVLNDNDPPNTSSTKPIYPISWEFYLILLSMIALCIGLVINRPNIDDSLYVNIAVTAADFPFSPLMGFDGLHNPGFPFAPSEYKLQTIELLHGALSWITGISAIYFPHIILYAFWAALIPLAYAELVKSLVPKYWIFVLIAVLALMIFVADSQRWPGNFSFRRLQHGKSILLSIIIPLLITYSIKFTAEPRWRNWLLLFACQIAAVGLSVSGIFVGPVVSGLVLVSQWEFTKRKTIVLIWGLSASIYVFISFIPVAVDLFGKHASAVGTYGMDGLEYSSSTFHHTFMGSHFGYLIVFAMLIAWLFVDTKPIRKYILFSFLIFHIIFLNPYTADILAEHIMGHNFYWRIFWLLPFLLFISLWFLYPFKIKKNISHPLAFVIMVATIAISVTLLSSKTTFRNATIKPFSLKVTKEYRVAEKIRELVDPNSIVVCPISVTSWLTTLHKHPYPLVARNIYIAQQVHYLGRAEVRERIALNNYIGGKNSGKKISQNLRELLEKYNVQVICVANDNKRKRRIENRISQAGYKFVAKKAKHKIWLKTGT